MQTSLAFVYGSTSQITQWTGLGLFVNNPVLSFSSLLFISLSRKFLKKKQNVSISNPVGTWDGGKIKQCLFGAVLRGEAEIKVQRYSLARDDYAQANPSTESCTRCDCPCDRNEDVKIGQREERMFG